MKALWFRVRIWLAHRLLDLGLMRAALRIAPEVKVGRDQIVRRF